MPKYGEVWDGDVKRKGQKIKSERRQVSMREACLWACGAACLPVSARGCLWKQKRFFLLRGDFKSSLGDQGEILEGQALADIPSPKQAAGPLKSAFGVVAGGPSQAGCCRSMGKEIGPVFVSQSHILFTSKPSESDSGCPHLSLGSLTGL